VIQFLLKIKFILLLILFSGCSSYDSLVLDKRIRIEKNEGYEFIFDYDKSGSTVKKNADRTSHPYKTERYFKGKNSPGPAGTIITGGILESVRGNYREAEFLFHETESLLSDGSPQNNLAVVYEASGRYHEAFSMYSRAILIAPEDKFFRSNFLLFLNQNYKEASEPVKKIRR
jgi:tetratricopeptide (TPR) repeat protein